MMVKFGVVGVVVAVIVDVLDMVDIGDMVGMIDIVLVVIVVEMVVLAVVAVVVAEKDGAGIAVAVVAFAVVDVANVIATGEILVLPCSHAVVENVDVVKMMVNLIAVAAALPVVGHDLAFLIHLLDVRV